MNTATPRDVLLAAAARSAAARPFLTELEEAKREVTDLRTRCINNQQKFHRYLLAERQKHAAEIDELKLVITGVLRDEAKAARWVTRLVMAIMLTLVAAIVATFAGCSTPPRPELPDVFQPLLAKKEARQVLRAAADAAPALPIRGSTRELQVFGESCRWSGPNPVILRPRTEPRVGTPLIVRWTLGGMTPPALHVNAVALLMAFSPIDNPVGFGSLAPGCKLLVRPDHVIMPMASDWLRFDPAAGLVTMEFTPAPGLEGAQIYVQLIAAVPEANQIGWVCSNGLEVNVGEAR